MGDNLKCLVLVKLSAVTKMNLFLLSLGCGASQRKDQGSGTKVRIYCSAAVVSVTSLKVLGS